MPTPSPPKHLGASFRQNTKTKAAQEDDSSPFEIAPIEADRTFAPASPQTMPALPEEQELLEQ